MNWETIENQTLISAILSLENTDEAKRFLRDLMTENEIDEFAKRLKVADMLTQKIAYTTIEKETGLSSTTIARVSKWLNGTEGGYRTIIDRLHHSQSLPSRRWLS